MQVVPYKEPLSKFFNIDKINLYKIDDIINKSIPFTCLPSNNNNICQIKIEIPYRELYSIELSIEGSLNNDNLFQGQSSFAVEMNELRSILLRANNNSLVL